MRVLRARVSWLGPAVMRGPEDSLILFFFVGGGVPYHHYKKIYTPKPYSSY